MIMKKLLPIFLLLFSINGYCEWTPSDSDNDGRGYIDYSTIKRSSNIVKIWELIDYKNPQKYNSLTYKSIVSLREYDCSNEKVRGLSISYFSDSMGKGNPVNIVNQPSDWMYLPPGSMGLSKLKSVCK